MPQVPLSRFSTEGINPRALVARERRIIKWNTKVEWLGNRWRTGLRMGFQARLKLVGQLLRDRVVINIAIPVHKERGARRRGGDGRFRAGAVRVTKRSRPGQYPRADTTRLMKDIFWKMVTDNELRIGTTLDYGLRLETEMERSFLLRTFRETQHILVNSLTNGRGSAGTGASLSIPQTGSVEIIHVDPRN